MSNKSCIQKGSTQVIIVTVLVIVLLGALGFVYWQNLINKNNDVSQQQSTQSIPKKQGTEVVSVDATYNKYSNYDLDISITYSKTVIAYAECVGTTPKVISTPIKIFEDTSDNKIFLSASKHTATVKHQTGSGEYSGFDSCVVQDTTLSTIKNPVDTITNNDWLFSMEFDYIKTSEASDLDGFVDSLDISGISIDYSVVPVQENGVYSYKFKYIGPDVASHNNPNWYSLIHSPAKGIAVFWSTPNKQQPSWVDIDENGKYIDLDVPVASILN